MAGTKAVYETIRTIDSATFTGAYQKIGTPIINPSSILKIVNNSNVLVLITTDGVNDQDVIPAGSFCLYDVSSDSQIRSGDARMCFPANTQFWIKAAAAVGLVYLVSIYQGGQ